MRLVLADFGIDLEKRAVGARARGEEVEEANTGRPTMDQRAHVIENAIQQAKQFHEAVGVTAIALTKLDGTAKGGVVIGISDELKLPVVWVGVGEGVEDLRRFDPKEFVDALFD